MFRVIETEINATRIVSTVYTDKRGKDPRVTQDYARNGLGAYASIKAQAEADVGRFNAAFADPQPPLSYELCETGIAFVFEGQVIIPVGEIAYFDKCDKCIANTGGSVGCGNLPWCYTSGIAVFNRYFVAA